MDLDKEILKCKADRTDVKSYILVSPTFRIENTFLHQGHKMLTEDGKKRLQYLKSDEIKYRQAIG